MHEIFIYLKNNLKNAGIKEFESEAKILFSHFTKLTAKDLILKQETISAGAVNKIENALKKRLLGTPVHYITKEKNFFGYDFALNKDCLIPRFDSEIVVKEALSYFNKNQLKVVQRNEQVKIFDICSGSGCLGISVAREISKFSIVELNMIDISQKALDISYKNASKILGDVDFETHKIDILKENFGNFKANIIICNPPYIQSSQISKLEDQVRLFEPLIALDGGEDGLKFYQILPEKCHKILKKNGILVLEIAEKQQNDVIAIFSRFKKYKLCGIYNDFNNIARCIIFVKNVD